MVRDSVWRFAVQVAVNAPGAQKWAGDCRNGATLQKLLASIQAPLPPLPGTPRCLWSARGCTNGRNTTWWAAGGINATSVAAVGVGG